MTVRELMLPENTGLASRLGWTSVRKAEVKYVPRTRFYHSLGAGVHVQYNPKVLSNDRSMMIDETKHKLHNFWLRARSRPSIHPTHPI